jgi:hypothetical protein
MKPNTANWYLAASNEQLSRSAHTPTLLSVLDDLLYQAFAPLYKETTFFRRLLMQVILYATEDNRRRISLTSKEKMNAWLLKAVYDNSFDFYTMAKLDRGLYVDLISKSIELLEPIEEIEIGILGKNKLQYLEQRRRLALLFGIDQDLLYSLYTWVKGYLKKYLKFKEMIVSRYYKLAYHEANKIYHTQSKRIDTTDLFKNLVLSTWKAVDRCDASQGTLTSFIQRSFLNAKTYPEFGHMYQTAYDVPMSARHLLKKKGITAENESYSYEDPTVQEKVEKTNIVELNTTNVDKNLLLFLRSVPGIEIGLLMLGVPMSLTEKEINRLKGSAIAD